MCSKYLINKKHISSAATFPFSFHTTASATDCVCSNWETMLKLRDGRSMNKSELDYFRHAREASGPLDPRALHCGLELKRAMEEHHFRASAGGSAEGATECELTCCVDSNSWEMPGMDPMVQKVKDAAFGKNFTLEWLNFIAADAASSESRYNANAFNDPTVSVAPSSAVLVRFGVNLATGEHEVEGDHIGQDHGPSFLFDAEGILEDTQGYEDDGETNWAVPFAASSNGGFTLPVLHTGHSHGPHGPSGSTAPAVPGASSVTAPFHVPSHTHSSTVPTPGSSPDSSTTYASSHVLPVSVKPPSPPVGSFSTHTKPSSVLGKPSSSSSTKPAPTSAKPPSPYIKPPAISVPIIPHSKVPGSKHNKIGMPSDLSAGIYKTPALDPTGTTVVYSSGPFPETPTVNAVGGPASSAPHGSPSVAAGSGASHPVPHGDFVEPGFHGKQATSMQNAQVSSTGNAGGTTGVMSHLFPPSGISSSVAKTPDTGADSPFATPSKQMGSPRRRLTFSPHAPKVSVLNASSADLTTNMSGTSDINDNPMSEPVAMPESVQPESLLANDARNLVKNLHILPNGPSEEFRQNLASSNLKDRYAVSEIRHDIFSSADVFIYRISGSKSFEDLENAYRHAKNRGAVFFFIAFERGGDANENTILIKDEISDFVIPEVVERLEPLISFTLNDNDIRLYIDVGKGAGQNFDNLKFLEILDDQIFQNLPIPYPNNFNSAVSTIGNKSSTTIQIQNAVGNLRADKTGGYGVPFYLDDLMREFIYTLVRMMDRIEEHIDRLAQKLSVVNNMLDRISTIYDSNELPKAKFFAYSTIFYSIVTGKLTIDELIEYNTKKFDANDLALFPTIGSFLERPAHRIATVIWDKYAPRFNSVFVKHQRMLELNMETDRYQVPLAILNEGLVLMSRNYARFFLNIIYNIAMDEQRLDDESVVIKVPNATLTFGLSAELYGRMTELTGPNASETIAAFVACVTQFLAFLQNDGGGDDRIRRFLLEKVLKIDKLSNTAPFRILLNGTGVNQDRGFLVQDQEMQDEASISTPISAPFPKPSYFAEG